MKTRLLPLAMLAGLAGAAGKAQAVYMDTGEPFPLGRFADQNKKAPRGNRLSQKKRRIRARRAGK